ncbi:MAG: hypothetical protein LDL11_00095 [Desulfarculus sp.]|nr:hypothetical protein [Desulfarculus sp.]
MFGFRKKDKATGEAGALDLPKPKDIPQSLGQHLVVNQRQNPEWVWRLKSVTRSAKGASLVEFRIFDPESALSRKLRVDDYNSLDSHPDLILFQGVLDKRTHQAQFQDL